MLDIFDKLYSVYWFCALTGSGMLVIQFLIILMGSEHEGDLVEDGKFKWMTKQALTGFLMMFGWVGLACGFQYQLSLTLTLLISFGAGIATSLLAAFIFHLAKKAHSKGTVFNIEDAIGKEATVYHRIHKDSSGKITISLNNFTHEIDAISPNEEEIPSFTQVQVIKKADDKTVVVIPLK